MTETEVRNEYFGTRSSRRDWLLTKTTLGPLAARARSDQWFEVRLMHEGTQLSVGTAEILTAVSRAFGFVLGHRVFVLGYEGIFQDHQTRCLEVPNQEPTRNSLLAPLGTGCAYLGGVECVLGRAIDFFLTDQGERVAQHLYLCWDTADNALPTRLAVASICVEGLLRIASQSPNRGDPGYTQADRGAFERWLERNPDGLTARFIARLRGFFGMLGQKRPVDVLRDWQTRGLLSVTEEDIEAWENTRNPSAHAELIGPAADRTALQTRVSRFYRVMNLMNRIVLQLMGYRGVYVDYSQRWREIEFPAAPDGTL
ncbi:MAG TPA: hypothetical protein VKU02_06120 [Gemmataceae bacterium]|nr:hypothetical protein [Gemmataceae bacterium]